MARVLLIDSLYITGLGMLASLQLKTRNPHRNTGLWTRNIFKVRVRSTMAEPSGVPRPQEASHAPDLLAANLPSPGHTRPDQRLQQAMEEACRVHQVTPILKEELRAAIMLRRLSSGQGEITPEKSPQVEYELTSEELSKREKRRAQNRLAAQRCRNKKRQEQEKFIQVYTEQNNKRQKLEEEVLELREEKRRLEAMLVHHMLTRACQKGHVVAPQNGRQATSGSPSISNQMPEDESFYDLFQTDSKKDSPVDSSAHMLPNDLDPELPVDEASLIYSLDSRQFLSDLIND